MNSSLLALSGKMTSGKSTIAKNLSDTYDYRVLSIGSNIKEAAQYLIEDTHKLNYFFNDFINKEESIKIVNNLEYLFDNQFTKKHHNYFKKNVDGTYLKNQSYRDLTQVVATTLRSMYGEDIWVNFISKQAQTFMNKGEKIVIDDMRLRNEMNVLSLSGFSFIRLHVPFDVQRERLLSLYGVIEEELLHHITEIDLDNEQFDITIDTSKLSLIESTKVIGNYMKNNNKERCFT